MANIVEEAIYKKALATINLDEVAKELAPFIRKELKDSLVNYVKDIEWYELLGDKIDRLMSEAALEIMARGIGGKKATKHSKK